MKNLLFITLLIGCLIPKKLSSQNKNEELFGGIDHAEFWTNDYSNYSRIPYLYRLILDNDTNSIKNISKKLFFKKYHFENPLIFACKHQRESAAHLLIDYGIDVSLRNKYGESALWYLAATKTTDTILAERLFTPSLFRKPDNNKRTPLSYSLLSKNDILFSYAIDKYLKYNKDRTLWEIRECFSAAMYRGNFYAFEKIVGLFNLNKPLFTESDAPLFMKKYPLEMIVEFSKNYNYLIRVSNLDNFDKDDIDLKMINLCIEKGMNIDMKFINNNSILFEIYENHVLLKYLVDKVDLNHVNDSGYSFLQFYIEKVVTPPKMILNGQDVFEYGMNRDYTSDFNMINLLINKGGGVNKPYANPWVYLLIHSAKCKNYCIIKYFFSCENLDEYEKCKIVELAGTYGGAEILRYLEEVK